MASFVIRTVDDERVLKWSSEMRDRLRTTHYFKQPFKGSVRALGDGLYAMHIEPTYPRLPPNIAAMSLLLGAFVAVYFGHYTTAMSMYGAGFAVLITWNVWWYPTIYHLLWFIKVRKLTGSWSLVRRAEQEVLTKVAYGKV